MSEILVIVVAVAVVLALDAALFLLAVAIGVCHVTRWRDYPPSWGFTLFGHTYWARLGRHIAYVGGWKGRECDGILFAIYISGLLLEITLRMPFWMRGERRDRACTVRLDTREKPGWGGKTSELRLHSRYGNNFSSQHLEDAIIRYLPIRECDKTRVVEYGGQLIELTDGYNFSRSLRLFSHTLATHYGSVWGEKTEFGGKETMVQLLPRD